MGYHSKRPRQAGAVGPDEPHKVQQIQVQGVAPGSWQPPLSLQSGGVKCFEYSPAEMCVIAFLLPFWALCI